MHTIMEERSGVLESAGERAWTEELETGLRLDESYKAQMGIFLGKDHVGKDP